MSTVFMLLATVALICCVNATIHDEWAYVIVFGLVATGIIVIDVRLSRIGNAK